MSGTGIPPELAAMMAGAGGSGAGPGAGPMPGMELGPTAGGEAVAQSAVAKDGLAAWKQVQSMPPGERPEYDLVKALMLYVLTEGPSAPEASAIMAWLADKGFNIPGMQGGQGPQDDYDEDMG
jgi:hypothetical protein